jgi:hypothetical protein
MPLSEDFVWWVEEFKDSRKLPTHYRQTPTTTACGLNMLIDAPKVTESDGEVDCNHCSNLRSKYLSKLGHSPEGTAS